MDRTIKYIILAIVLLCITPAYAQEYEYFDDSHWNVAIGSWDGANQEWDSAEYMGDWAVYLFEASMWNVNFRPSWVQIAVDVEDQFYVFVLGGLLYIADETVLRSSDDKIALQWGDNNLSRIMVRCSTQFSITSITFGGFHTMTSGGTIALTYAADGLKAFGAPDTYTQPEPSGYKRIRASGGEYLTSSSGDYITSNEEQ